MPENLKVVEMEIKELNREIPDNRETKLKIKMEHPNFFYVYYKLSSNLRV